MQFSITLFCDTCTIGSLHELPDERAADARECIYPQCAMSVSAGDVNSVECQLLEIFLEALTGLLKV